MILQKGEKMKYNKEDRRIVNEALYKLSYNYNEEAGWLKEDRDKNAGICILKAYIRNSSKNEKLIEEFNQTKLHDGNTIKWHFFKASTPGEYFEWKIPLSLLGE